MAKEPGRPAPGDAGAGRPRSCAGARGIGASARSSAPRTKMAEPPAAFCPTRWIDATASLRPLKDLALVAQAKPGFGGLTVNWIRDELDLGADHSARRWR